MPEVRKRKEAVSSSSSVQGFVFFFLGFDRSIIWPAGRMRGDVIQGAGGMRMPSTPLRGEENQGFSGWIGLGGLEGSREKIAGRDIIAG